MLNLFQARRRDQADMTRPDGSLATPAPSDVCDNITRGERAIAAEVPLWEEALSFFDNETFVERSAVSGNLVSLETRERGGKPRWRHRLTRNRYTAAIEKARSRYAARIPVPRASAPSHNAEAQAAASLAEKVCLSLYRKLKIKQLVLDVLVFTFNCGAGYVWPYWNGETGKFIPPDPNAEEGSIGAKLLREGEIGFWILHPRDVVWEPGIDFKESRWWCVRKAQAVSEVINRSDYSGPTNLVNDAVAARIGERRDSTAANLVFVYHYLERPSRANPKGRWLQIANGALIAPEREYPCEYDIPVIHELADIRRPHRDRPMGRGKLMIDLQRSYQRTINQIHAWKNLILNPQLLAPKGSIRTPRTEEPGLIIEYRPIAGMEPKPIPVQEIPVSLFSVLRQTIEDWNDITGDGDLPAGLESGSAVVQVRNEKDESRRAVMSSQLADFYGDLFGHMLYLVQKHYTEERLLQVKTRFGVESIPGFLGSMLMPGITVNVDPGSVQPRTREEQEAKLMMWAERGWIPPHQAMAAIRAGDADALIDEYELDVARAHREIQQLIAMGRMLSGQDPWNDNIGPVFAAPMDNHQVHLWVLGMWMKTEDFERQDELVKQATLAHYQQHEAELMWQQFMAAQQAGMQAESNGMANATRPAGPDGVQSQPSLESNVRALQGIPERAGSAA